MFATWRPSRVINIAPQGRIRPHPILLYFETGDVGRLHGLGKSGKIKGEYMPTEVCAMQERPVPLCRSPEHPQSNTRFPCDQSWVSKGNLEFKSDGLDKKLVAFFGQCLALLEEVWASFKQ